MPTTGRSKPSPRKGAGIQSLESSPTVSKSACQQLRVRNSGRIPMMVRCHADASLPSDVFTAMPKAHHFDYFAVALTGSVICIVKAKSIADTWLPTGHPFVSILNQANLLPLSIGSILLILCIPYPDHIHQNVVIK